MKILFAGGGTAGHVTPNIALIQLLHDKAQCYYIGTNGMEKSIVMPLVDNGLVKQYYTITAHKLQRKVCLDNFLLPIHLTQSVAQCKKILKQLRPDVVFSKGGYVSLPVIIAAHKLKIPSIIHESDMTMGLANKLSQRYATQLLSTFPCHPRAKKVGAIIRPSLYNGNKNSGYKITNNIERKPQLLVMGGSLGALQLNNLIEQCAEQLSKRYHIFVITGKNKQVDSPFVTQEQYITDIQDVFATTDICLTRGGSNSLTELSALNIPFAVLPLTHCSRGEQVANAKYFVNKGCGIMLDDSTTPQQLMEAIDNLYANRQQYIDAQKLMSVDGTNTIADIIMSYQK